MNTPLVAFHLWSKTIKYTASLLSVVHHHFSFCGCGGDRTCADVISSVPTVLYWLPSIEPKTTTIGLSQNVDSNPLVTQTAPSKHILLFTNSCFIAAVRAPGTGGEGVRWLSQRTWRLGGRNSCQRTTDFSTYFSTYLLAMTTSLSILHPNLPSQLQQAFHCHLHR